MQINSRRFFEAAARPQSFARAAEELGVIPAAVTGPAPSAACGQER